MSLAYSVANLEQIETVRKFFPETWIWQLHEVGLVNQHIAFFNLTFSMFSCMLYLFAIKLIVIY